MGADLAESRRSRSVEIRDPNDTPKRERWTGEYDDLDENGSEDIRESGKHRSKDKSKSSGRREEKEHRSRDHERSKERERDDRDLDRDRTSQRDRRRDERDECEKDKIWDRVQEKDADHEKHREKDRERERKDRGKEKNREREREKDLEKVGERGRDKEMEKEKNRDKDKEKERERERERKKDEREKHRDRDREKETGRDRGKDASDRERGKDKMKEKEKQADQEKERTRYRDRNSHKQKDEIRARSNDMETDDYSRDSISVKEVIDNSDDESQIRMNQQNAEIVAAGSRQSALELEERISKMREERLRNSEGSSEVLSWVNKSRKLEEKRNAEKEKALQLSKIFEEQDNMNDEESDDEAAPEHAIGDLGGVKVLHGIDKVLEGGAVVLTLKDQSILADGDINQEVDMLENVEIGEQKRRDEAYSAAKKKTGVYDDKFNDEPGVEKKILPQYDDPVADEGVTLDSAGRLTAEAERKLEELRKRLQGGSVIKPDEDLNSTTKISTDYYTEEEMMKFKKPKKKKSLRKREKLDIDALEAEAVSAGLIAGDLGSRNDGRRRNLREEQEKMDAEMRSNAFQTAYAKANEASKALQLEQACNMQAEEDDTSVFGDDDEELRKSLERARKIALRKQAEEKSVPKSIALLASPVAGAVADNQNSASAEQQEDKVIITEMEEFVSGLQRDEDAQKPETEDVFMEDIVLPGTSDQEMDEDGGWTEAKETVKDEIQVKKKEEEVAPDETIHESALGKGLGGTLKHLKGRGSLKETIEWGGRNMDKKKSKLVGIHENDGQKQINIERTDEYGRVLTPKEAFRVLSHKFHGKGPGKGKQEKRMRQYQEDLKIKQMKNADTPSLSVERMREAQAKLQTPYLMLSGHVKPGQSSDPRSGFATLEKDSGGGLTPMLGDRKVEHFLNIKRKPESGDAPRKKPKT